MSTLLGLDVGTGTVRVVAYDPAQGRVIAQATRPTPVFRPRPEWSEYAPEMLWQTVRECLSEVAQDLLPTRPRALGISSFGEPLVPLDGNLRPLSPLQTWYDRRCEPQLRDLETRIDPARFYAITGQRLSTSLGLAKWLWLLANQPGIRERTVLLLPAASYILWRLTHQRVVDYTIAARTGLFDIQARSWSPFLLDLAGLTGDQLPVPVMPGAPAGALTAAAAASTGLPAGMVCYTGGHDHLCATLAVGVLEGGSACDSAGTAEALLLSTPSFQPTPGLLAGGYAYAPGLTASDFFLRGGLPAGGGAVAWLAQQYFLPDEPAGDLSYALLEAEAAQTVGKRAGPLWLPHLSGSGTPLNDRQSMAAVVGLRAEQSRGDLFRGLLEAQACWLKYNLATLAHLTGQRIERVLLLGGLTRLELLSQIKATLLGFPVLIPQVPEPSAVGAALLAGIGAGIFASGEQAWGTLCYSRREVAPLSEYVRWYQQLYEEVFLSLYETLQPLQRRLAYLAEREAFSV
jgi:xylulokinase